MQRRTIGDGYVYFVKSTDEKGKSLVKIGYTRAFYSRMGVIEREEYPNEIYVIRRVKVTNPVYVEGKLHRKFAGKRVRGEWFNLSDEDIKNGIKTALALKEIVNTDKKQFEIVVSTDIRHRRHR